LSERLEKAGKVYEDDDMEATSDTHTEAAIATRVEEYWEK